MWLSHVFIYQRLSCWQCQPTSGLSTLLLTFLTILLPLIFEDLGTVWAENSISIMLSSTKKCSRLTLNPDVQTVNLLSKAFYFNTVSFLQSPSRSDALIMSLSFSFFFFSCTLETQKKQFLFQEMHNLVYEACRLFVWQ